MRKNDLTSLHTPPSPSPKKKKMTITFLYTVGYPPPPLSIPPMPPYFTNGSFGVSTAGRFEFDDTFWPAVSVPCTSASVTVTHSNIVSLRVETFDIPAFTYAFETWTAQAVHEEITDNETLATTAQQFTVTLMSSGGSAFTIYSTGTM